MKNKFKYLVNHSLKKKISTKWFKVVNVLICLLIVFLINMDSIINLFGGDFNQKDEIYVVDNTGHYATFENIFKSLAEQAELDNYELKLDNNALAKKEELDDEIIVVINSNETEYLTAEVISYDAVGTLTYQVLTSSLNMIKSEIVYQNSGLSPEEIAALTSPVTITETVLNEDAKTNETKEMLSSVVTTVVIIPFFILIVTMVQMIGAEINDEKTSRGMEIIISSVPAKMHFLSKVLAALSFVIIQGLLLFGYVILALLLRKFLSTGGSGAEVTSLFSELITMLKDAGTLNLLLKGSIVLIIMFVVSFFAYAIVSATLASMTTNNEDFQQLQTPLMIIMLVGYYLALMSVVFDGSLFINIVSYIPLLSVMLSPTLYLLGQMSLVSLIGSTAVTCVATYFLYIYGLRIYKVGILNYSSSKLWKKMFKSLKNK